MEFPNLKRQKCIIFVWPPRILLPDTPDMVTKELLGEHSAGEEAQHGARGRVQLPHQPILPPDTVLVYMNILGEEPS